jgi:hypothetical protein
MDSRSERRIDDPRIAPPGQRPGSDSREPRGAPAPNIVPPAGGYVPPVQPRSAAQRVVGEEVLHAHPGPGVVRMDEEEFRERMELESPDGRPPPQRDRRGAKWIFGIGLAVAFFAVLSAIWWYAGAVPGGIAILLMILFIGMAAWPAWHAAMDRKLDGERVKREVAAEHTATDNTQTPRAY